MKIYLSGPISGYELEERQKFFQKAEDELKAAFKDAEIINPMMCTPPSLGYTECMKEDLKLVLESDVVFLLDGWQHSKGCDVEFQVAKICGIPVFNNLQKLKSWIDIKTN